MRPFADLLVCLRFFSRLPVPAGAEETRDNLAAAVTMVPVAGLIIGLGPALALAVALGAGLPPFLSASLAIAILVATTGALHEDGLADCADGFGGGHDVTRKLEIMRDSRIGTFGACALALSLLARVSALGAVAARSPLQGVAAILLAAFVSRVACLSPLLVLPPARSDGLGAAAQRPDGLAVLLAVAVASLLTAGAVPLGFTLARVAAALAAACLGAAAVCLIARQQIRGQTGDVAGAAQQVAEIAVLTVMSAAI